MTRRMVITGAAGLVGSTLAARATAASWDVVALTSSDCDITDAPAVGRRIESGDVVVNCAAYTAVDRAEADADRAHLVNAVGPENLARACAGVGARLVHISTDYVFGGDVNRARPYEVDDPTAPLGVYGRTKLEGELAVRTVLPTATVIRTAWVYGGADGGTDFVSTMRRLAAGADPLDVVADQTGSPTYVGDLVDALLTVADGGVSAPLVHAANQGGASRYDQAVAVFDLLGADVARVRPVSTDRHPRPAPRPRYSVLAGDLSESAGLPRLRPWRDALAEALGRGPVA